MYICKQCGAQVEDGAKFCNTCGTAVEAAPAQQAAPQQAAPQYAQQPVMPVMPQQPYAQPIESEKKFWKVAGYKNANSYYIACIVFNFLSAAMALVNVIMGETASIIDLILFGGVGIWMCVQRNWIAGIVTAAIAGIGLILMLVMEGTPSGWLLVLFGICAAVYGKKAHEAYVYYQQTGIVMAPQPKQKKNKKK